MGRPALIAAAALVAVGIGLTSYGLIVPVKAWLSVQLLDHAWTRVLAGEGNARPWPWMDSEPVARLTFSATNKPARGAHLSFVVMRGVSGPILAFAPGWHERTALPGESGTTLISAHRDTHFALLKDIARHDRLTLQDRHGRRHVYEVSDMVVTSEATLNLPKDDTRSRLLLVTCYPLDDWHPSSRQRLVVVADPI
ncbi:MAG: class GN sortase [Geminicoccaceae bacterium]